MKSLRNVILKSVGHSFISPSQSVTIQFYVGMLVSNRVQPSKAGIARTILENGVSIIK